MLPKKFKLFPTLIFVSFAILLIGIIIGFSTATLQTGSRAADVEVSDQCNYQWLNAWKDSFDPVTNQFKCHVEVDRSDVSVGCQVGSINCYKFLKTIQTTDGYEYIFNCNDTYPSVKLTQAKFEKMKVVATKGRNSECTNQESIDQRKSFGVGHPPAVPTPTLRPVVKFGTIKLNVSLSGKTSPDKFFKIRICSIRPDRALDCNDPNLINNIVAIDSALTKVSSTWNIDSVPTGEKALILEPDYYEFNSSTNWWDKGDLIEGLQTDPSCLLGRTAQPECTVNVSENQDAEISATINVGILY